MLAIITFELDERWAGYKNFNPIQLAKDMDLIHKPGIRIINVDLETI